MKFQTLTIHNLTSIKDATINFHDKPIADSDVFLITGDTGAGKTTILDAICLALYNEVPRMDSTNIKGKVSLAGTNKPVEFDDPRQLMRPLTAEAFASLTFIGNNNQHYEAKWSVGRARNKVTGNIKDKKWTLTNLDTNQTYSNNKDIKKEILHVTNLDFTQFCRTSMLSQGEFTRFLESKDDEKAEILEKITGVDKYSKIGKKIFDTFREKEDNLTRINEKIGLINCLSDNDIEEKKQRLETLTTEIEKDDGLLNECQAKSNWLSNVQKNQEELQSANQKLSNAQKKADSDSFKANKELVDNWNKTIDIRATRRECDAARQESNKHKEAIQQLFKDYQKHKGAYLWLADLLKQKEQEQTRLSHESDLIKAWVPMFEKEQVLAKDFSSISDQTINIGKEKENIAAFEQSIAQLEEQKKQAKEQEDSTKKEFEEAEKSLASITQKVNSCNMPSMRGKRDGLIVDLQKITDAINALESLSQEKERRKENAQKLDDINKTISKYTERLKEKAKEVREAEIAKETLESAFNNQKNTIDDWAKAMRATLKIGDTCPICQHKIESELPHEEDLKKLFEGIEHDYLEAKKKFEDLDKEQSTISGTIQANKELYKKEKEAFDTDNSVQEAKNMALAKCNLCGIDALDDDARQSLEGQKKQKEEEKEQLEKTIAAGEEQESQKNKYQEQVDSKRKGWTKAKDNTQAIEDQVSKIVGEKNMAQNNIKNLEGIIAQAKSEIRGILIPAEWNTNWETNPQEAAEALSAHTNDYKQKTETLSRIANETDRLNNDIQNISQTLTVIDSIEPEWGKAPIVKGSENKSLINDIHTLHTDLKSHKDALGISESKVQNSEKILSEYYALNPSITPDLLSGLDKKNGEEIKRLIAQNKGVEDEVLSAQSELKTFEGQREWLQKQKPATLQESETLESIVAQKEKLEEAKKKATEEKAKIDAELKQDTSNKNSKKGLLEEMAIVQKEHDNWKYMNELYGDANGKKLRRIAQSYVLADLISAANNYMQKLTDRYTLSVVPGSFIINVIDAYDGYIARSSSTISGGEKFLVSLALALALSDIGTNWSTDILFIDEGFGTLSGDPLQKAIDTLHSLNKITGRHVGIISHIKELAEKIPVQIQVIRPGFNACSTVNTVVVP